MPALVPPGSDGQPDSAPSGVRLSRLVSAMAEDIGTGQANRQQLIDLQSWVRDQRALSRQSVAE